MKKWNLKSKLFAIIGAISIALSVFIFAQTVNKNLRTKTFGDMNMEGMHILAFKTPQQAQAEMLPMLLIIFVMDSLLYY